MVGVKALPATGLDGFETCLSAYQGTWVNNRRLEPHVWHPLENGDALMFASSDDAYLIFESSALSVSLSAPRPPVGLTDSFTKLGKRKEGKNKEPEDASHAPLKEMQTAEKVLPSKDTSAQESSCQGNDCKIDQGPNPIVFDKAKGDPAENIPKATAAAERKSSAPAETIAQRISTKTTMDVVALRLKKLRQFHTHRKIRMSLPGILLRASTRNRFVPPSTVMIQHLLLQMSSNLQLHHHEAAKHP
ncbi:hypothetical protein, conserved [Eimeria praecox]|uniref:FHA domain-containing protein n=1 Tax=Eimeria praecox TaxID=51316 RepID=U6GT88_9EIME|nr:hypothetical protein, conserved [Eimeria praecox]